MIPPQIISWRNNVRNPRGTLAIRIFCSEDQVGCAAQYGKLAANAMTFNAGIDTCP
jgi:hypothetical protein